MSQTIISKGKDVIEAINLGLDILNVTREDVSIEIIQQETKSFFRSKPAVVKLTHTKTEKMDAETSAEPNIEDMIDKLSSIPNSLVQNETNNDVVPFQEEALSANAGKVWVKGGRIFGQPSNLTYPTISVAKGIDLYKNKEKVDGIGVVTGNDLYEVKLDEEYRETKWHIEFDKTKLNVKLHIEPGAKITRTLKDVEPSHHIELHAEESIEIQNTLTYKDVVDKLDSLRVVHGFIHNAIMAAVEAKDIGDYIIAAGTEPKEGKNGSVQLVIEDKEILKGPKEREDGTVDFRELKHIPVVNQGQVIAIIHPPVPGIPGNTVTNEPIPAKQTAPILVQTGYGTALIENETKIVATETGRPKIDLKGQLVKVSIVQKMVHHGDVNMSTGNLRFKGDIDVLGSVEENMRVEADGVINVKNNANRAIITSKNSIIINQNVIGSTLSAGKTNILVSQIVHLLTVIEPDLKKFMLSIDQLLAVPAFKISDHSKSGLHPLIRILLEKKYQNLTAATKEYIELCNSGNNNLDSEFHNLAESLRLCLLASVPNAWHSKDYLNKQYDNIQNIIEEYKVSEKDHCFIELKYTLNSFIYCSGDVTIKGQGCYNSKIHCGGELQIKGVLRGGEVHAGLGASVKEVGSDGGVTSLIAVPSDQKIKIGIAREGTTIQIGKVKHTFMEDQQRIEAALDENNRIVLNKGE
ncbi:hypothetical protein CVD25_01325 [Bacillus canaveralius]|uniref:RNA-binding protein KhpB N-terminal domain-containing protein n=1 Tax=Bacillus canaveralius TaxID=1403243 RepID=A0A2N5GN15_9BACI|nr:FapA family protein [Bacillus canaveralius]PLR83547.1 hypothetical protein CU635_08945 [Bacillus canaveralius]PLS00733.1 hypothetical protein CVD25_01325 [Bacillus canaveralius]RSK48622.1 DUF342 domain-containing protein [Bacillus canaveralius]